LSGLTGRCQPAVCKRSYPGAMIPLIQTWLFAVLALALFAIEVWAFINALRFRPDAYVAAGKRTKTFWGILTGVAMLLGFLSLPSSGPRCGLRGGVSWDRRAGAAAAGDDVCGPRARAPPPSRLSLARLPRARLTRTRFFDRVRSGPSNGSAAHATVRPRAGDGAPLPGAGLGTHGALTTQGSGAQRPRSPHDERGRPPCGGRPRVIPSA